MTAKASVQFAIDSPPSRSRKPPTTNEPAEAAAKPAIEYSAIAVPRLSSGDTATMPEVSFKPQPKSYCLAVQEMKLENFDLSSPYGDIEIRGLGHAWDLHNFATFQGFTFQPTRNELCLEWRVGGQTDNPWGSRGNSAGGCRIRFVGVRSVIVTPRDAGYPAEESLCLAEISKVIPGEREFPYKQEWGVGEQFHLRLKFQDERYVDIEAESAVLEALK